VLPGRKLGLRGTRLGALHGGKLTEGVILQWRALTGRTRQRSGRGDHRSGRGGAPWRRGTCGGVDGVGEQPEEAATGGVLTEEDDGGGTPVAQLR
jgi:hypothetical protein